MEAVARESWKLRSNLPLQGALQAYAPGVMEEIFGAEAWSDVLLNHNGVLHPSKAKRVNGPLTKAHMDRFSAKIAMASFNVLVGRPIEMSGAIYSEWRLNGGMSDEVLAETVSVMPAFEQLVQGKKVSGEAFGLRYNTNGTSIVAGLATFHRSLFVTFVATDDKFFSDELAASVRRPHNANRPTINLTKPGLEGLGEPDRLG